MYVLILIFVNALTHVPTPSAHVIPYPSRDECAAAGPQFAGYEAGVETGKATAANTAPDTVYWYCIPAMPPKAPVT